MTRHFIYGPKKGRDLLWLPCYHPSNRKMQGVGVKHHFSMKFSIFNFLLRKKDKLCFSILFTYFLQSGYFCIRNRWGCLPYDSRVMAKVLLTLVRRFVWWMLFLYIHIWRSSTSTRNRLWNHRRAGRSAPKFLGRIMIGSWGDVGG